MADQVRIIIKKKWVTAEELDEIRRDKEHQNNNEDIGTKLEGAGSRLESSHFLSCAVDVAPLRR